MCIVYSMSSKSRRDGAPKVEGLRTELIALPTRLSNLFDDKIDRFDELFIRSIINI